MDENPAAADNAAADQKLQERLALSGFMFLLIVAGSVDQAHQESSFGIAFNTQDEARQWGRDFRQRAVFWVESDELWLLPCGSHRLIPLGNWASRVLL